MRRISRAVLAPWHECSPVADETHLHGRNVFVRMPSPLVGRQGGEGNVENAAPHLVDQHRRCFNGQFKFGGILLAQGFYQGISHGCSTDSMAPDDTVISGASSGQPRPLRYAAAQQLLGVYQEARPGDGQTEGLVTPVKQPRRAHPRVQRRAPIVDCVMNSFSQRRDTDLGVATQ